VFDLIFSAYVKNRTNNTMTASAIKKVLSQKCMDARPKQAKVAKKAKSKPKSDEIVNDDAGDEQSGDEKSGDEQSGAEKSGNEQSGAEKSGDEQSADVLTPERNEKGYRCKANKEPKAQYINLHNVLQDKSN
jgi:hypothetical protein